MGMLRPTSPAGLLLRVTIVVLALATGWIHWTLGGVKSPGGDRWERCLPALATERAGPLHARRRRRESRA